MLLGDLHINYETIEPFYALESEHVQIPNIEDKKRLYHLKKMKFARKHIKEEGQKKSIIDKSVIIYNDYIHIKQIPEHLYDYSLNGRSAIEWVMDRYQITKDKTSEIINDPNDAATEPQDILLLLLRVMRVADESLKLIDALPTITPDTILED